MVALPLTLEQALSTMGYSVDVEMADAYDITLPTGTLHVPAQATSKLVWGRPGTPALGDDLYLSTIPLFDEAYRVTFTGAIIDAFGTRRLAYDTLGQFQRALRRWGNRNMQIFNQRWLTMAVTLPLDDHDSQTTSTTAETTTTTTTTETTEHNLAVNSDFPESLISGSGDYASSATDTRDAANSDMSSSGTGTGNSSGTATGRNQTIMALLDEQRASFINVLDEVLEAMEPLFLNVWDQPEQGGGPGWGGLDFTHGARTGAGVSRFPGLAGR